MNIPEILGFLDNGNESKPMFFNFSGMNIHYPENLVGNNHPLISYFREPRVPGF